MSGVLRLKREGVGIEMRRLFAIRLDGTRVGTIRSHETFEAPIHAGRHTLRLHSGRYSSREHASEVPDDEVTNFQCHSAMMWPRYVISLVEDGPGISLRHI
jgi:hypothetical protein